MNIEIALSTKKADSWEVRRGWLNLLADNAVKTNGFSDIYYKS